MDDKTIAALKTYVAQGGTLWADGLAGWKTEFDGIRPSIPGGLADLIGAEAFDVYPVQAANPYSVTTKNELGGELWKLPLSIQGADVVLRDKDGNAFALKHRFGKGQVFYYSSVVSLAYLHRGNADVQQWITEPAANTTTKLPVSMKEGSAKVLFRGMVGPTGPVAILSNWGETQQVVVSFEGRHKVREAISNLPVSVKFDEGRSIATMTLPAGASTLLKAE